MLMLLPVTKCVFGRAFIDMEYEGSSFVLRFGRAISNESKWIRGENILALLSALLS